MEKTKQQLGKEHSKERPELLSGEERFYLKDLDLGLTVKDFWQFQFSNLIDNLGYVAEFLIAKVLNKEEPDNCNGWSVFDLRYKGKRIEVKATSYWQPWKKSGIISEQRVFSIKKVHVEYQNVKSKKERQNDIYIFCVDEGKDKESSNPLNLKNWTFYIVPTDVINKKFGDQKTLSLKKLKQIETYGVGVSYDKIKDTIDCIVDENNV